VDSFHAHQPFQCLVNGTGWAALSCQFGTMFTTYDAASDQLTSAYNHEPRAITGIPPQWVNPDPAIAKAQAEYKAALKAARRR
jgi:hypothetical protein